jgi:magnesium-transporting ATPase (P-type)
MKTFELAFNSKNKFMIRTLALSEPTGLKMALSPIEEGAWKPDDLLLTIKGAPDIIVERCSKYVGEDGNVHALDAAMKSVIEDVQTNGLARESGSFFLQERHFQDIGHFIFLNTTLSKRIFCSKRITI